MIPVVRFVGNSRKFGSGYLVDDRVVLTASHCVHGEDLAVWLPGGGQRPRARPYIVCVALSPESAPAR